MAGKTVNPRHIAATVTVPAGTAIAAPQRTTVPLGGTVNLRAVEATVPPGNSGLVGWAVETAGGRILPFGDATVWIIGDGFHPSFNVDFQMPGALVVAAYNLDIFAHSLYLRFEVWDLDAIQPAAVVPVVPIG